MPTEPETVPATGAVRDRIIHIADLHFWRFTTNPLRLLNKRALGNANLLRRMREFDMARADDFAAYVCTHGVQDVLLTGDFSCTALDEEFVMARRFVDGFLSRGCKVVLMPGNHDVYTFESVRKKRFEKHFGDLLTDLHNPFRITLAGGTPMIVVPTVCPNWVSSRGRITPHAVARTRELIEETDGPVVVAGHYPILRSTPGYQLTNGRRMLNAELLHQALGDSKRKILYVCGHVHRFTHVQDARHAGLQQLSTGAFFRKAKETQSHGEFSEIHAAQDGFNIYRHRLTETWMREAIDEISRA